MQIHPLIFFEKMSMRKSQTEVSLACDGLGLADEPSEPRCWRDEFSGDDIVFCDAMHEDKTTFAPRKIMDDVNGAVFGLFAVRIGDIMIDSIQRQRVGPCLAVVR